MSNPRAQRLAGLLRAKRRADRIPGMIDAWNGAGIAVSALSPDQQKKAGFALRKAPHWQLSASSDFGSDVLDFILSHSAVIICDWGVDEHPAFEIASSDIHRSIATVKNIYPDGFLLFDQKFRSALVVDFDEDSDVVHTARLRLAGHAEH